MSDTELVIQYIKEDRMRQHQTELLKICLKKKWYLGSSTGLTYFCAFCKDTCLEDYRPFKHIANYINCENCLCPPEICANHTQAGFINNLVKKYNHNPHTNLVRVNMLTKPDLTKMIQLFVKYIDINDQFEQHVF